MPQILSHSNFCFKFAFVLAFAAVSVGCTASAQVQTKTTGIAVAGQQFDSSKPSGVVAEMYAAMREKRFRAAFLLTSWRAAVESLTPQEIESLRADIVEPLSEQAARIEISGEQISGEAATVFIKTTDPKTGVTNDKHELRREAGAWVVVMGDRETEEKVRREGKNYFFNLQIELHHSDVQAALQEIIKAEFVHNLQKGGAYVDLATLVGESLLSPEILGTATGYQYHLKLSSDGKKYTVNAEPTQYGKTGKLSFLLESAEEKNGASRLRSEDKKGQPLKP